MTSAISQLVFPLAAVGLTFLVLMPLLTGLSRAVLARSRARAQIWAAFGTETTFAWLVAPTALPLLWLTSAALHQTERRAWDHQLHPETTTHADAALLFGLIVVGLLSTVLLRLWRERPQMHAEALPAEHPQARRLRRLLQANPRLRHLRVRLVREAAASVYAAGWLRPTVYLDLCFATDADDEMLTSAILHERAHLMGHDTLRDFIVRLCLSINPFGRWLRDDFGRWQQAREAQCDSEAVQQGGDPLALAAGILRGARHHHSPSSCAVSLLCGHSLSALELRLALLLNGPPSPVRTWGHRALFVAVMLVLTLPHLQIGGLDQMHEWAEQLTYQLGL